MILCEKILSAIREIQTNSYNIDKEDFYNNQIALFLRGYYGEANVHREKPQGSSGSGKGQGETDILVYQNGYQFALIESIRLQSSEENKLNDHMERLLVKYDTQGTNVTFLLIFAITKSENDWFSKIANYLNKYKFPFEKVSSFERVTCNSKNICHHVVKYKREGNNKGLHVFTALINPVVKL